MKRVYLLLLVLAISSCSFSTFYQQSGSIIFEPVSPEIVEIHTGDIDQEYFVIGVIAVDAVGNGEKSKQLLKEKAAELGANAVIKTELSKIGAMVARTGVNGIAVRVK